jgi:hypothetical protein
MKVITRAVFQLTDDPEVFIKLEEESYEYTGPVAQAGKDGPDFDEVAQANKQAVKLARELGFEHLDWAKEQWADQKALLDTVLNAQLDIQEQNRIRAEEAQARYEEVYQPIEDQLIADIESLTTPARIEADVGRAVADVSQAFETQREMATRNLESYGIDPSQTRYEGLDRSMRASEAVAQAQAANRQRLTSENVGRALRSEAINIGRGYPGDVGSAYGTALAAGSGAISGMNQTVQTGSQARNITGYLGAQNQALGNWGNVTQAQGAYGAGQSSALWGGIGTATGAALGGGFGEQLGIKLFTQDGGYIQKADGGIVDGAGGPKSDAIPANLSDGEYVIPSEVVLRKGTEFFDRLVEKTREGIPQPDQVTPNGTSTSTSAAARQMALPAPTKGGE